MPTLAMSAGKVTAIWGQAFLKLPNGKLQALKVGDKLVGGERVITTQDGIVEISPAKGHPLLVKHHQPEPVLSNQELDIQPAAGPGGANDGMQPGLRIDRVHEPIKQLEFHFEEGRARTGGDRFDGEEKRVESAPSTVSIGESVLVNEGQGLVSFVISLDKPSNKPVTVTYSTQDGTAVAGQDYVGKTGTVTFQPGQTQAKVTIELKDDNIHEDREFFVVHLDGATGANVSTSGNAVVATIIDDDPATPSVKSVTVDGSGGQVVEGQDLVYHVTLSGASNTDSTYHFALGGGTASESDYNAPQFSGGVVLNSDGTVTVPAGVTSFTVTVPTVDDSRQESSETLPLTVGDVTATGTILDNDASPVVVSVNPVVSDATVHEGADLVYQISLSKGADVPVTYAFSLGGGTAGGDDVGTVAFSDGVEINPDGTITVPAGVTHFTVTVPTVQDDIQESNETLPLTVGGVTATGTILDDDGAPTIQSVEPGAPGSADDSVTEGSPLVYNVSLSNPADHPTTFEFKLGDGTASANDIGAPVFSDGVTLNPDGTITVPAGVTSFSVTVPTVDDTAKEPSETVPLTIGGVTGTGVIEDNDPTPTIQSVEPGGPGLAGDAVTEGEAIVFTVTLSNASHEPTDFTFKLGEGSISEDDIGTVAFSDGVEVNADGTITVPAGVTSFTVTIPTVDDTTVESDEVLPLTVGDVTGVATIVDNDGRPAVASIELAADKVTEGAELTYTVTLSAAPGEDTTYAFSLGGGSASAADIGTVHFNVGVLLDQDGHEYQPVITVNPDGTITVPAGVTSFTVTIPAIDDTIKEGAETLPLTVGGVTATGTILDNDGTPTIQSVEPAAPGTGGDGVTEGTPLVYSVSLTNPSDAPTVFAFKLGGGTAGSADLGKPAFSDGVTLNDDGTITVPAGVTHFTVSVPTVDDTTQEPTETVPLTVGDVTGVGHILDNDGTPTVVSVEPGAPGLAGDAVTEGSPLAFNVSLTNASDTPTTLDFKLGGGLAGSEDIGAPTFSDGVTLNPDGTITVPAGVTTFTVTVPTTQDTLVESSETVPLTVGGVTATATIVDDDSAPAIKGVDLIAQDVQVTEGASLAFSVSLSGSSDNPTTFAFKLGDGTATAGSDFGQPSFSDGVTLNPDGTITVPAGVTSFKVTVPTIDDLQQEPSETVQLSVGGVSATGTILDNDNAPTIKSIEPDAGGDKVTEGTPLTYQVNLSGVSSNPSTFAFKLGGGTAGADDIGKPVFSDGVSLNDDGTITVPAGVTHFTVTVPTIDDTTKESDETVPLSIGGVSVTGTIVDNDATPTIKTVEPGQPGAGDDSVTEGQPLVYNVDLSNPSDTPTTFTFKVGGGTAGADDIGTPSFSDGVTLNPDGTITVPAGVTHFTVTVPTIDDATKESSETVPVTIGGVTATGTIVDNDGQPVVVSVDPSAADIKVPEGADLVYKIALSNPSDTPTTYSFSLGGGTASAADIGPVSFSDGVSLNADGTITVPAGVVAFSVTVSTIQDNIKESDEVLPLTIGGVKANGTILDDDATPTIKTVEPGQPGTGDDSVTEGSPLVYNVDLSNPSDTPTTFTFKVGGGTAGADDIGTPSFSDGVTLNPDGTITVPAGVTHFTVTVPTIDDTTKEANETVPVTIGGVTATGTIVDNDGTPTIKTIEPGQPGASDDNVTEGQPLVYNVALSNPSDTPTTFTFKVGGGTAGADDIGAPSFSDGVTLNPDGTITVPAGVTHFSVTVPTIDDTTKEANETLPVTIGGVTATGTIVDNDGQPTIKTIEPGQPGADGDQVTEGTDLVYHVALSNASDAPSVYAFKLGGGTASADDIGAPTFSDGVTLNPDGTITVPAGVTTFSVTVPTIDDTTKESDETVPLTIGGVTATGTIVDNDATPTIKTVEPGQPGTGDDSVTEGSPLVYNVDLSNPSDTPTTFTFKVGVGTAGADDIGTPSFSDGVTLNPDGTITVPAGVTHFTVTVPTIDDTTKEANETVPVTIGGVTATGTIVDNDPAPTIKTVEPGAPGLAGDSVTEGQPLVYNVALSNPSDTPSTFTFKVGGGTASADDIGTPSFSDGVTLNPDGTITVPAGVTHFSVTVPTTQDTIKESSETVPVTVGGVTAVGTIVDDDSTPAIKTIDPIAQDVQVPEGSPLAYKVALSNESDSPTIYAFKLGGGTATAGSDYGSPTFSDGVVLNADGTITVPAHVTTFTVTVPTVDDTTKESDETVPLTIGGVTATGTIVDNDSTPTIKTIEPGQPGAGDDSVTEGQPLVYNVDLSNPSDTPTTFTFKVGGGTAGADDIGTPSFSDGVTLNPDGTITVPAGVTHFTVTVPTIDDTTKEANETLPVTIGGVTATGTIVDNDGAPTIKTIEPGQPGAGDDSVPEGTPLVYNVDLSNPSDTPTTFTFKVGGGTAGADDIGTPSFSDGVTLNPDGTITVPAGVTHFSVTVPTIDDTTKEANETVPVTIGGVTATGTIVDNDGAPTIKTIEPGQPGASDDSVPEGTPLVYNVDLSNPSDTPTTYAFKLGGGTATAGSDYSAPSFSDGVTLNPDGTITVPAGVTSFKVTVPTLTDGVSEPTETVPLVIGGTTGVGQITDTNGLPQISINDVEVNEAAGVAYFTVKLDQPSSGTVTVDFGTKDGTAVSGVGGDFVANNGTLTFAPGETSKTIAITINNDAVFEGIERYTVELSNASANAQIGDGIGQGGINDQGGPSVPPDGPNVQPPVLDNDAPTVGSVSSPQVTEGGVLGFQVALTNTSTTSTSVTLKLAGVSATLGSDTGESIEAVFANGTKTTVTFDASGNATVSVPAGQSGFTLNVPTLEDSQTEPTETLTLTANANGGTAHVGTGSIIDNDAPPAVDLDGDNSTGAGGNDAVFTFTENGAPLAIADVDVKVADVDSTNLQGATIHLTNMQAGDVLAFGSMPAGITASVNGSVVTLTGAASLAAYQQAIHAVTFVNTSETPSTVDRNIEVTVTDGTSTSAVAVSTIHVVSVNDVPTTQNYNVSTDEDTQVQGKVVGADKDGDNLTYTANDQPLHGTVTVSPDGNWVYNPLANYNGTDVFTVTVDDGQGGTTTSTINVTVKPVNDAPVVQATTGAVSEEGLPGGLPDNSDQPFDTTNAKSVTGQVVATDVDDPTPSIWTLEAPTTAITSGGAAVTWSGSGSTSLTATANGQTVATLSIDSTGKYTFNLVKPLDHPVANQEDVLPLTFKVTASDGQATGSNTLTINVEDDAPSPAVSQTISTSVTDANVMVVLDLSSSMRTADGVDGTTRFASAINSIKTLLDKYDAVGDVRVRLVTFGTDAQQLGDGWTTVSAAKSLLDSIPVPTANTQGTNYDAALAQAMSAFANGTTAATSKLSTGVNVSYFLSDGLPTYGSGSQTSLTGTLNGDGKEGVLTSGDEGIQTAEETAWKNFLTTNGINSYALGMGTGAAGAQTALDPIAYNGKTSTDTSAVVVTAFSQLDSVLGATVPDPVSGNLLTGSILQSGGIGADGPGFVKAIVVDGVTYTYDPANGGSIAVTGTGTSKGTFDAASDVLTVTAADGAIIKVNMLSGDYNYVVPPSVTVRTQTDVLGFTISDNDGDTTSATLSVNVTNTGAPIPNDPPVVTAQSASVSEEGLPGGLADTLGTVDKTNSATVSGKMVATDPDGNAIAGWTLDAPTTAITSGGTAVVWTGSGTSTLIGKAGAVEVAKLTIDGSGNYTFTLEAPLDHPVANAEDVLALGFKASASDGRALGSNTLTINVEDDSPATISPITVPVQSQDTNVMVVLDLSTSMNTTDGVNGTTRLASAISSINTLLDKYDALGDVHVRLVTFGTDATARGDVWTTLADAKALLAGLGTTAPVDQGTNYDAALASAISAYGSDGKLSGAQSVAYFISDGTPTFGAGDTSSLTGTRNGTGASNSNQGDEGIQASEETAWKNFLAANDIDAYALGVGSGLTATNRAVLDPIAYDGRAEEDRNGLLVTSFSQLDGVLATTVAQPASGNLLTGSLLAQGGAGADGGAYIHSLTVDGVTYTYTKGVGVAVTGGASAGEFDATTQSITITTKTSATDAHPGKLVVDLDGGDYHYEVGSAVQQVVGFSVSDADGDTVSSTLTFQVSKAVVVSGTAAAETFSGTAGMDVTTGGDGADTINGGTGDDQLYGNGGNDVINGGAGADLLHGGAGADALNGGDGDDKLVGGAGGDVLTGGQGADVFAWHLADPGTGGAGKAIDTVKDFSVTQGDQLDLRDLLVGETDATLDHYLEFDTSTANTVIKVSPTGGFIAGIATDAAETQRIVLENVNIRTDLGLTSTATDAQVIAKLLAKGALVVDHG